MAQMSGFLLFTAVLMAGALLEAQAEVDFSFVEDFFNTQEETITKRLTDLKESMGDRFNSLNDKMKSYFENQNFSAATAQELLAALETKDWEKMEPRMLRGISSSALQDLADKGGIEIPERLINEFERIIIINMTDEEVISTIKEKMPKLKSPEMSALLMRLGPVSNWTKENIDKFGETGLNLPVCFDDTGNKEVLQKVLDKVNRCETTRTTGCPQFENLEEIRWPVTWKIMGPPKNWKSDALGDVKISEIPDFMVNQVDEDFVKGIKAKLIEQEELPTLEYQAKAEAWMAALCKTENCKDMSAESTNMWLKNLSKLRSAVTPSDVSPAARKNTTLMEELERNALAKKKMRAEDAAILLEMKIQMKNQTLKQIGGKLAAWAPAGYLADKAEKKELAAVRNELASTLDMVRGPEYEAKVRAAMKTEMEAAYSSANDFSISSVNDYLEPFLRPKLLVDQSSATLLNLVKNADKKFINLDPYQMKVIASKISSADIKTCPPSLCMSLSSSSMKDLSTAFLAEINRDLAGVTLPCLLGAKKIFSVKTTLTKTDIQSGKAFLQCMSYEDASKVDTSEIFNVLEEVTEDDLSWAACRAWKMVMMKWAEEQSVDEEFLKHQYLGEISKIPACILALFEPELYDLNPEKKKAILNNLCNSKNYFTIPKEARGKIVNQLLADIRRGWGKVAAYDGPITQCSVNKLNSCLFDLNRDMLRKMDEAATEEYIQLLETSLREGIPDCVNQDTMDEVAEMIIRIKGSPRNWKTAENVSCILDTFSSEGINRIASELPADVLITTGCPHRSNQYMSIPKHCKDASMRAMKAMKSRKTEKCIERRGTLGTGDSMRDSMMCGNAARITQAQLERMKKEDVMKYLDNLVTEDLGTAEAKVILTKVKENKELKDMNGEELARLKNAWEGLTKQDVGNLPTLTATENLEVLYQLGTTKMLPDDVMVALRDKIIAEKQPEEMTDMDVFLLGDIVCHFNQSQTSKIPKAVIKKSMRHLGMRDCKTQYGTQNLAEAVKAAYGDVKDFDAATVHEMNRLVSGLKPEDLSALSGDAYVGFTAEGIEEIEPDTLKVMTVAQANNLDGKTAAAVTSEQVRVLPSEVKNALSSAKSEQLRRSSASGLSMPGVMGAVVAAVLFLL